MSARMKTGIARLVFCVAVALSAGSVALAQDAGGGGSAGGGDALNRLIFTLGVLLVLAQGAEQLTQLLRLLLAKLNLNYAAGTGSAAQRLARDAGVDDSQRTLLLTNWSLLTGMLLAVICGVDTFEVFSTGDVLPYGPGGLADLQHLPGILASGLIASMGSGFLHDVIGIVKTIKDTKDEVLNQTRNRQPTPNPNPTPGVH